MKTRSSTVGGLALVLALVVGAASPNAAAQGHPLACHAIMVSAGEVEISWLAEAGMHYEVFSTSDLAKGWMPDVTHPATFVGSGTSLTVRVPLGEGARFFRVRASVNPWIAVLTADGGTYHLADGITLDVPPGAVVDEVRIAVAPWPVEEIQPVLDGYGITEKTLLAAFHVEPGGLEFPMPIRVTLPVLPLPGRYSLAPSFCIES